MFITFRANKMEKELCVERKLQAAHGDRRARLIKRRMQALRAAANLGVFWPPYSGPERCHQLSGDHSGRLSMDLDHPYRLIFIPNHNPRPIRREGGIGLASGNGD